MKIQTNKHTLVLVQENNEKIYSESAVVSHIRRLLNEKEKNGKWIRCYPNKIGLTDCTLGVRNRKRQIIYWHDRYAIEEAHKAFNQGAVTFIKNQG